jgi:hyaluronoglucosaminidase
MKRLLFFILLVAGALNSAAQTVTISPLPQKVTWGECAFANDAQFYIVGANTADVDAVNVLTEKLNIVGVSDKVNAKKFPQAKPVIIGDVQDKAVAKYKKLVPEAAEGYYLNVSADQVVIAGRDNSGTFYGVQSFIQVMSAPKVMQCEISDYPSVTERGVIEGFYGNPWSHADRLRQFDFYGKNKLNIYVYGPKDDPYHRSHWRQPYPEKEAAQLKELVDAAHKNKVKFVWAIHPACDIRWGMEDYNNIVNKLNLMYEIGVRTFAVFFDDVSGEGARADMQTDVMNYLTDEFVRKHSDVEPLIMCPSQYNKNWSGGDYLSTLSKMYPEIRVMWTGNSVVDMIGENDMQWINDQIKRKAFIWLNYPVNDYCQSRLLMGKTYGNDLNINHMVSGFCSNPMEYAEASKVSLYSIADYAWNMPSYNSETSWERALKELMPTSHEAFRIFCENNVDLGVTYHGLRRDGESPKFDSKSFETLSDSFAELVWAADNLLADEVNSPEMLAEIRPWVESMRLLGVRGQMYLNMVKDLENKDSVAFVGHYKALTKLTQQQKAIVSRDYEGSIVKAKPVVSGDVITPWILDNVDKLIKTYKANYSYCAEIFPVNAIEDGVYLIKVNGEYLTNVNAGPDKAGDYPVFVAERDNINPQRQEWVIEHNNITGRYKIYNKQDGRYINEAGAFWRSTKYVFHHDWNTYNLVKVGDRWSIQNGGRAGEKYWKRSGDRITGNGTEDYIFEIEKIN